MIFHIYIIIFKNNSLFIIFYLILNGRIRASTGKLSERVPQTG